MAPPIFYYDLSSPYSYLAAARVDEVLPERPEWRPIAFGVIVERLLAYRTIADDSPGLLKRLVDLCRKGDFDERF